MATSTLGSGTLVLAGTTSGTTTVTATAVAGTTTLTLPAATDTLVGKATTDTLTNKTLTGAAMNGTLGATTPSTVAATTLTTSSTVTHNGGTANGVAYLNGSKVLTTGSALVFDGSNLGVGNAPYVWLSSFRSLDVGSTASFAYFNSGSYVYNNAYYNTSSNLVYKTTGYAQSYIQNSTGQHVWQIAASGTAGNAITFTQAMTLDASGNLLVGTTTGSNHYIAKAVAEGSDILGVLSTTTNLQTAYFMGVSSAGENAAAAAIGVRKNSSTSRSINAAGTINASGADYAEYMTKAGNFTVAKGDVVGIDANGKLTNVFADSVSFMVKSTDPSYVGGDVWGTPEALGLSVPEKPSQRQATEEVEAEIDEEFAVRQAQYEADKSAFDAALEAARQRVDRISFCGQVPVNVMGATAGQYIIPVNNNGAIKGEAVSNPTFEQYQTAVGKVIAIESDGRAKIIVKVA